MEPSSAPKRALELIFVHVPKTGGSSIREALNHHYGSRLYADYGDAPADPTSPMNLDPEGFLERARAADTTHLAGIDAIIGHLWIRKYEHVPCRVRAVVLRDPVERTISNYFFWMATDGAVLRGNPLRQYLLDRRLTLLEFARTPIMRWFYTRQFFRDTDMRVFDHILDAEAVRRDWSAAMRALRIDAPPLAVNKTEEVSPGYDLRKAELLSDRSMMARLRDVFADDIDFYERHTGRAAITS